MNTTLSEVSRLDVTQIFGDVDDFCRAFEQQSLHRPQLLSMPGERLSQSRLSRSEVMTIVIAFQGSGYRTFKEFYTLCVLPGWRHAFPKLVSYNRFVELMPWCLMLLCCYLYTRTGEMTGLAFIDSTPLEVCHPRRARSHKVFQDPVGWSKNSMGWHFGFKLHLVINERGELLAFKLTPANTDDRVPVPELTQGLIGKLFGDRGYIRQERFEELYERGLELVTNYKKKKKNKPVKLIDKIMLRKRALIETVNDQLKNIFQIAHSRHRSPFNFLVNTLAALVAYTYQQKKPALDLEVKDLAALPEAIF